MVRILFSAGLLSVSMAAFGQQPDVAGGSDAPAISPLSTEQSSVTDRFKRLEDLLLRSSELEAGENPARAALLRQAAQLGKQAQLADLLAKATEHLKRNQYSEAIEGQKLSRESLKQLLELLQSENREERVREQRDQVRRWIEETDRLMRLQGSLRGRTEGGQDANQASKDQERLAKKAAEIASDLGGENEQKSSEESEQSKDGDSGSTQAKDDEQSPSEDGQQASGKEGEDKTPNADPKGTSSQKESSKNNSESQTESQENTGDPQPTGEESPNGSPQSDPSDSKDPQSQAGESQSNESQPKQSEPNQSQPQQGQPQQGQPQQGQPQQGQPQQGQPQQGQPQQGQQQENAQQQQPQTPTERAKARIEQAKEAMKEAQKELDNAKRDGAIEKQREAEENLREAIEELEEILRQLREEEIERSLASLETRLRRMLEMEKKILEETKRLSEIAGDGKVARQVEIQASNLSLEQRKVLSEGERAYLLLRDEGSSAAFPEAMEQVNADIAKVADRLSEADVGGLTLLTEEDIVSALEEMVAALVQVQKDNKEKQQQQQQQGQQPQGQPGEQPLVDKLAEIRLIRTLQQRINKRTDALSKMLDSPEDAVGQSQSAEIQEELRVLSERELSIWNVTREIEN